MALKYFSTRDKEKKKITSAEAILQGLAPDGGLYVPERIPRLHKSFEQLAKMSYKQVAYEVMSLFFQDYTEEELRYCINSAYNEDNFDTDSMASLVQAGDAYFLELYHGRTIAFKDMALSILPYLMTTAAQKCGIKEEIVILTATSGDTGKAALAGFAGTPGTRIAVYYPKGGVSRIQELQMLTQEGDNTCVVGVKGNFDDTQTDVKRMFSDENLKARLAGRGFRFSSANSINIGRLIPQVVYYVYAYTRLMPKEINFVVPTGNFGNILAAHYAAMMGVPVHKLICASNDNKVLYDFFETGIYDRNREFKLTESPSMDILISSNLERFIYELAGDKTAALMDSLKKEGKYTVEKDKVSIFTGGFANESKMRDTIAAYYKRDGYVMDTHTGVAAAVYDEYRAKTGDDTTTVIVSTASPFKFARSVMKAIAPEYREEDDFGLIDRLSELSDMKVPKAVTSIKNAKIRHDTVVERDGMQGALEKFLGLLL